MNEQDIQELANEYKLDVRPFSNSHFRLFNNLGNYIIDIYIKRRRNGIIIKNSFYLWKSNTWEILKNKKQFVDLL